MAKRYHHTKKEMMREMRSENRDRHNARQGYYEGPESRQRLETQDGGMIREDHSAVANLPQTPMMKAYPMNRGYIPEVIDDTIRGIDSQIDTDNRQREKYFGPHKY